MKTLIGIVSVLLLCAAAFGQATNRISLTITITNVPVTSNTLTINSTTRIWSNLNSVTYISTNLVSTNHATTNLADNLADFPLSPALTFEWLSSNSFRLRGGFGASLSASQFGDWCSLTLATQSGPQTFTALWPMENMAGSLSNRTNQGSSLVYGLSQYSTQAFATNATAVSNLLHKGAGIEQVINTAVRITNSLRVGAGLTATNGYWTNAILGNPRTTNLVNYGNAISSPNTNGFGGENFGQASSATGIQAFAAGRNANALGAQSTAVGSDSYATNSSDTALGNNSIAGGGSSTALGVQAQAIAADSTALGKSAIATNQSSVAIGNNVTTLYDNEVRIGRDTLLTSIGGRLQVEGSQTNTTFRGTNVINGRVDFTSRANSSLVNGANSAIVLGSNVFVRLSGATTVAGISGFAAEQDGSYHIVQFSGAITNVIVNEANSTDIATDATAANRIVTGTGTNYYFTNSPLVLPFIYDATAQRWKLSVPR